MKIAMHKTVVVFDNEADLPCPLAEEDIAKIIGQAIQSDYQGREVSVVCLSAEEIQTINHEYRHYNKPTNVLSFPYEGFEAFNHIPELATQTPLGEILLCPTIIEHEAREQGKSFLDHFTHLLIHGTLHLQGFDHETPEDASIMEALEIQMLCTLNIPNPYEPRGTL